MKSCVARPKRTAYAPMEGDQIQCATTHYSPSENSSYSNQTVLKKKADFKSKPCYDSLKLKALFELQSQAGEKWGIDEIKQHQQNVQEKLRMHYSKGGLPQLL